MADIKYSIDDILSLVEQNFFFLHIGKFLAHYTKEHNLSLEAKNITIILDKDKSFMLRGDIVKDLLSDIYIKRNRGNILGYFVGWNAFRGIAMAMCEGIKGNPQFKDFLKDKLKYKFGHFYHILAFIRNTLSHNIDNEIIFRNEKDFEGTAKSFQKFQKKEGINPSGIAKLDFLYSRDLPGTSGLPDNYGFNIEVNFSNLQKGQRFIDIVSEWHLFMIAELCYNLSVLYKHRGG